MRQSGLLLVCLLVLLQGCGVADKPALLEPPFAPVEVASVRAGDLWPAGPRHGRVVVTEDGTPQDVSDVTVKLGPGTWRMSVGGFWVVDVRRDESGSVCAIREVESAEERRVEYDPPLPLLPAELRPDETIERTSTVYLYNHANGALEATGDCTATYRLLGTKTIPTQGNANAQSTGTVYVVETTRHYNMPLVAVDMRLLWAYAPGKGPVAGQTVRVVKLLGMIPVIRRQSVERLE